VKIEYSATPDDIGALYSYLWRNSAYFRQRISLGTLVVAAWILISVYLSQGELAWYDAFIAINVAIAFPILTPLLAMLRTKNRNRILTIDPAGIHTQIGKKKGRIPWEKIAEVFVTGEHLFILGRNLNAFTIPNRAFQDDSQRNQFIQLCQNYSKQRSSRTIIRQLAWWILGLALAFLAFFSPWLYEAGWHLRHGDVISFQAKHVPIPRGWIAKSKPQSLTLTKLPVTLFTILNLEWSTQQISISKAAPLGSLTLAEAEDSFEKSFWTYPPMAGGFAVIGGPLKFGKSPNEIFCMTTSPAKIDAPVFAECLFQQGTWQASFLGARQQLDKFYDILHSVH
jgi:hypothetical protein